jgi:hypothetical protein
MRSLVVIASLASCGPGPHPAPLASSDDACALIDAMLAIDSPAYQELYANKRCGLDVPLHDPLVIDLQAPRTLVAPGAACAGRRFRLFHGERDLQGAIIELRLVPAGAAWSFMATVVQPNLAPSPEGGFDASENYCHLANGLVERRDHGWYAFERASEH